MYGSLFCRIYNEYGWNEYPRAFGLELLEWLGARGVSVRTALDLGCGTGELCEVLGGAGIETLGVDLSGEMIAIARRRGPKLRFEVGDMVRDAWPGRFDLVTCTGDALNHVTDAADVRRVFSNVRESLRPGGLFAFDLLKADEVPEGEPFEAVFGEDLTVRFSASRDGAGFTELRIRGFRDGAEVFSEVIREKLYDVADICDMLRQAGLEVVHCDDRLLRDTRGTTWVIVAERGV